MTSRNQYVFDFTDDGSLANLDKRIARLRENINKLAESGRGGANVQNFSTQFLGVLDKIQGRVTVLRTEIETLQAALAKPQFNLSKGLAALVPGLPATGRKSSLEQREQVQVALAQREAELRQISLDLTRQTAEAQDRLGAATAKDTRLKELANSLEARRLALIKQISGIVPGGERLSLAIQQRRNNLIERERELREALLKAQERIVSQTPDNVGRQGVQESLAAAKRIRDLEKERIVIASQVAAIKKQTAQQELAALAGDPGADADEAAAADEARQTASKDLLALENQLLDIAQEIGLERIKQADAQKKLTAIEQQGGAAAGVAVIRERLQQVQQALQRLNFDNVRELSNIMGQNVPEAAERLLAAFQALGTVDPTDEKQVQELQRLDAEARELVETLQDFKDAQIAPTVTDADLLQQLPAFERTLLGAFRGIGRRFQATLQFAISGALIFQVQRLVREFAQAAVEVERSFKDIATALEFDIPAPRGTAAFEQAISRVRDRVIGIANDFNVLPSVVNQAAFQMISRFSDIDAAMTATRAQVLATKVATIDQSEALRALTGIAEAYGASLVNISDDTQRQRMQAQIYADVLDQATVIQQQFGIAVEDSLEGAAGAAEVYVSLGLSQQQLLADTSALVRRTGQSGQFVFDRLQRFVSQIADPSIQNKILDIAAASDALNLSLADFTTDPGEALQKLREQFPALQAESSSLANALAQVFGKREASFVRGFFATGELSAEILNETADAAGRAEQRVGILLSTMQGSIEGITAGFQTLAQRLQELGAFTPFSAVLQTGDLLIRIVNSLVSQVNRLANLLNVVRLPQPLGGGLGDLVKTLLAAVVAATTLRRLFDGLGFVAGAEGLKKFFGVISGANVGRAANVATIGTAGTFGFAFLQRQMLTASQSTQTLGKTIRQFFVAPLSTVKTSILAAFAAFTRFLAAIGIGTTALCS
jgi:uncharacterized small protein (DUF1192 family)